MKGMFCCKFAITLNAENEKSGHFNSRGAVSVKQRSTAGLFARKKIGLWGTIGGGARLPS